QRLPSGPAVIPKGWLSGVGTGKGAKTVPAGVMCPIRLAVSKVNQRLPSGPAVISLGPMPVKGGSWNSATTPPGVIRPILLALISVNQRLPSGPAVMPQGPLLAVGTRDSVMLAAVPVRLLWTVSVTVTVCLPAARRVTANVCAPLSAAVKV